MKSKHLNQLLAVIFLFIPQILYSQNKLWQPLGVHDSTINNATQWNAEELAVTSLGSDIFIAFQDELHANKITVRKYSGIWTDVGNAGISIGGVTAISICASSNGTLYIAYRDSGNASNIVVKQYNGNSWVNVGQSTLPTGYMETPSLAIHNNDPYLVYVDPNDMYKANLIKFDGTAWSYVGSKGVSLPYTNYANVAIDGTGTPYLIFTEGVNGDNTTIHKYNGTSWVQIGSFLTTCINTNQYPSIVIDGTDNNPFVFFRDGNNSGKATVKKYDGSNWNSIGLGGFSDGAVSFTKIKLDNNNTPYVFYEDLAHNSSLIVKKYDGTNWVELNKCGATQSVSIDFCIQGNSPVVFHNKIIHNKGIVKKYDGTKWEVLGEHGITGTKVEFIICAMDTSGVPYVSYPDPLNDLKPAIKKYDGISWSSIANPDFADTMIYGMQFTISAGNEMYAAYIDYKKQRRITLKKFDGVNWTVIGTEGFSGPSVDYFTLCVDKGGTPYVVYPEAVSFNRVRVMKYDGNAWVNVGGLASDANGFDITMALDNNGIPHIAYRNIFGFYGIVVKKFDGTNWLDMGATSTIHSGSGKPRLTFDSNNDLYIAYYDGVNGKGTIRKYDGQNWNTTIGGAGNISTGSPIDIQVYTGVNDTLYTCYLDYNNYYNPVVKKFNGTNWIAAANNPVSGFGATSIHLAIRKNKVLVAYANMGGYVSQLIDDPVHVSEIWENSQTLSAYPNPANNNIMLNIPPSWGLTKYSLITTTGQIIRTGTLTRSVNIDVQAIPAGLYIITVEHRGITSNKKLVVAH